MDIICIFVSKRVKNRKYKAGGTFLRSVLSFLSVLIRIFAYSESQKILLFFSISDASNTFIDSKAIFKLEIK